MQYKKNELTEMGKRRYKKGISEGSIFYIITVSFMLIYCFPFIIGATGLFRYVVELIPYVIFAFWLIYPTGKSSKSQIFIFLLVMIVFNTYLYYAVWVKQTGFFSKQYAMLSFWFPIILLMLWRTRIYESRMIKIAKFFVLLLVITSITTIYFENIYPLASRELAGAASEELTFFYYSKNIGGYGFIYGLVFAIPFILNSKIKEIHKYRYLIVGIFLACIIKSEYLMAILFAIIVLMFEWYINMREKSNKLYRQFNLFLFILMTTMMLTWILFPEVYIYFLDGVLDIPFIENNELFSERIRGIQELLQGANNANDVSTRMDKYTLSINAFAVNPIWGGVINNNMRIGGHSELLDTLGGTGIIGFLLCFFLIRKGMKVLRRRLSKSLYYKYRAYIIIAIVFSSINTIFYCPIIMIDLFLCPLIIEYVNNIEKGESCNV